MYRYDAVFFDAGHTLLAPSVPVADAYLSAARTLGCEPPAEPFRRHLAECWGKAVAYRSAADGLETSDELEREAWRRFTAEVARPFDDLTARHETWLELLFAHFDAPAAWVPMSGAHSLLEHLRAGGTTVGIVSNWHTALHAILDAHGLTRHCDFVLTSAEAGRKKPHPHIFELALARAGSRPERSLHVGDSLRDDVEGARAAGLEAVLIEDDEVGGVTSLPDLPALSRWLQSTSSER